MTLKDITTNMEAAILKGVGVAVEVTMRGKGTWTISGDSNAARTAASWLVQNRVMVADPAAAVAVVDYDDGDDDKETYCYLAEV